MIASKRIVSIGITVGLTCLLMTACSKRYEYSQLAMEYRQECSGDLSVKCRDMLIRGKVALEEAKLELLKQKQAAYVQCHGEADYDELQALLRKHADYLGDLRPNFFSRHLFSSREVELPDDDFPGNARMHELESPTCHATPAASPDTTDHDEIRQLTGGEPASSAAEPPAGPAVQPEVATAASATPDVTGTPDAQTAPTDTSRALASDGPAVLRCGWIENDMPSSLTLQDRDGTWQIVGASGSGSFPDAEGFDRMPPTNKGDACGCLSVETNRQAMRIVRIFGGKLKPVSACRNDKNLR